MCIRDRAVGEDMQLTFPVILETRKLCVVQNFYPYHYWINNKSITGKYDSGYMEMCIRDRKKTPLNEYERTGITLDSVLTSQLIINIFEKNTPLHDGAVIVRGDRIVSATCYLPLSDNLFLSKELGTRHRAAVGISEVTDSLTIVVSEETGAVSTASQGELKRNLTQEELRAQLTEAQDKTKDTGRFRLWKGRVKKHEKAADK